MSKKTHLHSKDLKGLTSIVTDATLHITTLAEELNHQILHPSFLPTTPIQQLISSISGLAYSGVRLTTKLIGSSIKAALSQLNGPLIALPKDKKDISISILNGIIGDYLATQDNPLSLKMQFRNEGMELPTDAENLRNAYTNASGKILLTVHGLCMSDLLHTYKNHNHSDLLAKKLGCDSVYLNYNSGLHISGNGRQLNSSLEILLQNWPVPVEELVILSHSMGGLVSRSAIHYAQKTGGKWIKSLKKMIFLGTPHHGAALERIGNHIDQLLSVVPYAKPFGRLAKLRSSGITDLRYGNLTEEDWQGIPRFEGHSDNRVLVPLPTEVACYFVAATISDFSADSLGDGLVQLESALGQHKQSEKSLHYPKAHSYIAQETNHLELLSNKKVYEQLLAWLKD